MDLMEKRKTYFTQSEVENVLGYDHLHRGQNLFNALSLKKKWTGYTWFIPRKILKNVYFKEGLIEMKKASLDESNSNSWIAAKILQGIFNTDIKYFKYNHYNIIYFNDRSKQRFLYKLFSFLKQQILHRHKINIVISEDSTQYGFENTLPFYYNKITELLKN